MNIAYIVPFSKGFKRMKKALFQPFNLKKWFIVGFTAFLAGLTNCLNSVGDGDSNGGDNPDLYDVVNFPYRAWDWLLDHPGWFALIVIGTLFFLAWGDIEDFEDIEGDEFTGIKTLPILIGMKKAAIIFSLISSISVAIGVYAFLTSYKFYWLYLPLPVVVSPYLCF